MRSQAPQNSAARSMPSVKESLDTHPDRTEDFSSRYMDRVANLPELNRYPSDFVRTVFRLLEEHEFHYCLLLSMRKRRRVWLRTWRSYLAQSIVPDSHRVLIACGKKASLPSKGLTSEGTASASYFPGRRD